MCSSRLQRGFLFLSAQETPGNGKCECWDRGHFVEKGRAYTRIPATQIPVEASYARPSAIYELNEKNASSRCRTTKFVYGTKCVTPRGRRQTCACLLTTS